MSGIERFSVIVGQIEVPQLVVLRAKGVSLDSNGNLIIQGETAPTDGDFSLYVRAYWPKAAVLDGSWTPPAVQKVN